MTTIEIRRHSLKQTSGDAELSQNGIELAQQIGAAEMTPDTYTHIYVSPLLRTTQTAQAFSEGVGGFMQQDFQIFPPHIEVSELPLAMELWNGPCHDAEANGEDMMEAVFIHAKDTAEQVAQMAAESYRKWYNALPNDATVLIVNHSPFIELLIYGLTSKQLQQLQPCEGIRITGENQIEEIRL